jgi:exopolyphosphatase/guanosine-5'-triphosphate,3'-diphosphate pyrophosphatase
MTETVAAIDCGTNSIKILIGALPEIAVRDSRVVRLGQGVDRTGSLAPEALDRTFAAIEEFAELIEQHDVSRVRFCATSASRDADNSHLFVEGVQARLGVVPEVLSGAEEAALVYAGATRGIDLPGPVLVVDIGGGSSELVLGSGQPEHSVSMDIGSVRLHERHLHTDPPTGPEIRACLADIDAALLECGVPVGQTRTAIGTSGTIKTVAAGLLDLPSYDRDAIDGAVLSTADTSAYVERLLAMTVAERKELPYMSPGRADVIGAGALIWLRILAAAGVTEYHVSEADILHGIAWSLLEG